CGVAGYARALAQQLDTHFEVKLFGLDQYLLRNPCGRLGEAGDKNIKSIASGRHPFDSVSIQLEYGTCVRWGRQIIRRLRWLVQAAPDLSITFHTVLRPELSLRDVIAQLRRLKLRRLSQLLYRFWRTGALARRSYKVLRQAQKRKRLVCITHTRQD